MRRLVSCGSAGEDGRIPERYPLRELPNGGYGERTARNVADSDGTLIITFGEPKGGTQTTIDCCIEQRKPHEIIDGSRVSVRDAPGVAKKFIEAYGIRTLNVAGPRASEAPEAYQYAFKLVAAILNPPAR